MKKIITFSIQIFIFLLMTGCVTVTSYSDNTCYRYIDYNGEEHYMDYHSNNCGASYGNMYCRIHDKRIQVLEYDVVACPVKEENDRQGERD